MINVVSKHIIRFLFLVFLQVLVLNNVGINGYLNPYLYVLFILLLPVETPAWLTLVLGFLLGFSIDIFTNTIGMHTAATVFMAYARIHILKMIAPRDGYEFGMKPVIPDLGVTWVVSYAGILIILHHLALFYIEVFRFSEFFSTTGRAISSAAFTFLLVMLSQFLIYSKR